MQTQSNLAEKPASLAEICREIESDLYAYDEARIKIFPAHTNRASEAGHECERYLVYSRLNWQDRQRHDVGLQRVFDEGNIQEAAVLQKLAAAGITVLEQQRSFEWKEFQLTGHVDGKIKYGGIRPIEIKSFSPANFAAINTVQDMIRSKRGYMRKYPAQMQLYLLMDETPEGMFLLKNKTSGEIKLVPCELDYEYAEGILKKLENVNTHVAAGTYPDQCDYSLGLCEKCPFNHLCLPDQNFDAAHFTADQDFIAALERREELKRAVAEYEELDEEIKASVKLIEKDVIAGEFLLKRKHIVSTVAAKAEYKKDFWTTTIVRVKQCVSSN